MLGFPTTDAVQVHWSRDDAPNVFRKTAPASVRRDHADALKEIRSHAKRMTELMRVERRTLESALVEEGTWTLDEWNERFTEQRSVGWLLARRLVWRLTRADRSVAAVPTDEGWSARDGTTIRCDGSATVRLWHPAESRVDEIEGWKRCLLERRLTQPFKQVWREVYLPNSDDPSTVTRRFSGQVVDQRRFHALAERHGWTHVLGGSWDGGYETSAYRTLTDLDTVVELEARPVERTGEASSPWRHLVTGDLRIVQPRGGCLVELASERPRAVSEILRDADMLTAVPNVGRGEDWNAAGSSLPSSASCLRLETEAGDRRELLTSLMPVLPFRERCTLAGRYLLVSGSLGEYRIHLGSGRASMAAGNRALTIESPPNGVVDVFLPFEGDPVLVDILWQAQRLSADHRIRDDALLSQIRGDA